MRPWLLWVIAAGCIEPQLVECPDGRLCPIGTACDVAHASCVAPEQLTACADVADLTECLTDGHCFDGVCITDGCGNGFVELDELCDDGNTTSGDGCSAECISREVCGDGYVDRGRGEECDDQNTTGHDGCTAACTPEDMMWTLHGYDGGGKAADTLGVYDTARGNIVVFGGLNEAGLGRKGTWTWNGSLWESHPVPGPDERTLHMMAYDEQRRRTVLFGGLTTTIGLTSDTWEFTGDVWVRVRTANSPPARLAANMFWDGTKVVMFGGTDLLRYFDDTWTFDGTDWTQLAPATSPPARAGAVAAREGNRVVLHGGVSSSATYTDTWTFDGTTWSPLATTGGPALTLSDPRIAYDAARNVSVIVARDNAQTEIVQYELSGSTWTRRTPASLPTLFYNGAFVYDPKRQRVVLIGGTRLDGTETDSIVEWDGNAWTTRSPEGLPPPRADCMLAYDPIRQVVVMHGASGSNTTTWEWDGNIWRESTVTPISSRAGNALAFDPTTREVLLFGGTDTSLDGETWTWNGTRWMQHSVTGPTPRTGSAMAADIDRSRVVLFGGNDGTVRNDTWEWDGSTWTLRAPAVTPPARSHARLAYDPIRKRTVMFGGQASGTLDDTWEWDGTTWHPTVASGPPPRFNHSLVYNPVRKRVVVFGGVVSNASIWEWDGTTWSQVTPIASPFLVGGNCGTYDARRDELVSFGGGFFSATNAMYTAQFVGDVEEVCIDGVDGDGDGAIGCADADCARLCP